MSKLLFILIFTFTSISLHAYAKRIILVSFSTQERAQTMMEKLPTVSPSLYALAKQHNFEVKLKKSGKYYILVAEIFKDKKVLNEALVKIRKRFKGAYVSTYKYPAPEATQKPRVTKEKVVPVKVETQVVKPKVVVEKKAIKSEVVKPAKEVKQIVVEKKPEVVAPKPELNKVIEKAPVKKIENKQERIDKKIQKIEEENSQKSILDKFLDAFIKHFEWTHLVILVMGIIILRYYIKFKRIYDEY